MQTILTIDDEESVRRSYRAILSNNYHVLSAPDGRAGLDILAEKHVDLILLDLTMPGMGGKQVLEELRRAGDATPVIVITASNTVTSAVEAMRLGANDYIIKPFDVDVLQMAVSKILADARGRRELEVLRDHELHAGSIIGSSAALRDALARANQAMRVDSTVLITGESGTGKDVLARAIHTGGRRAPRPFVPLSCCAIPMQLIESELFGHEKGAFTGADHARAGKMKVADEGTLFLDEIGEMPLEAQAKLLRVLQDGCFYPIGSAKQIEVDIRVIAATNRNLADAIASGTFREDLYYRINVLHIELPPLRDRKDDIPELVMHFAAKHAPRVNARTKSIAPRAMARLLTHPWPGNIRELENFVERLLVYHGQEPMISTEHVAALLPLAPKKQMGIGDELDGLPLEEATRRMERFLIKRALDRSDNVQSRAAELLGTTRRILKYKMDQLEIPAE